MSTSFERFALRWLTFGSYLLLLSPLIYSSAVNQPFLFLKHISLYVVVEVMLAIYVPLAIFYPQYRPRRSGVLMAFTALVVVLCLTAITGENWSQSLWSSWSRFLGLFTFAHFYLAFIIWAGLGAHLPWRRLAIISLAVATIGAVAAFFQGERPGGLFGNPTFFAGYLLFHLGIGAWLAYSYLREQKRRLAVAAFTALALILIALFLTETRGSLVAFAIGVVVSLGVLGMQERRRAPLIAIGIIVVLCAGFFFSRNASVWQSLPGLSRFAAATALDAESSSRLQTLRSAWAGFKERPVLGWGWENFNQVFNTHYEPEVLRMEGTTVSFDRPHNILFDYAVAGGTLGLAAFLALLAAAVYASWKIDDPLLRALALGVLAAYLTHNLFIFDTYGTYLMLAFTLAFIHAQRKKPAANPTHHVPATTRPVYLFSVLMLLPVAGAYLLYYPFMRANRAEFLALAHASQNLPREAFEHWDKALDVRMPYSGAIKKNYLDELKQLFSRGIAAEEIAARAPRALRMAEEELQRDFKNYNLSAALADAYIVFSPLDQSYLAKAEAYVARSRELSPRRQHPYYLLAKIALARNDAAAALAAVDAAVALDPLAGDAHFTKALTAFTINKPDVALQSLARAKELGRDTRNAHEDRTIGGYLGDAQKYEQALHYLNSAIERDQNDLEALLKKGWVLYASGNMAEARATLQSFLTRLPNFKSMPAYQTVAPIFIQLGL